MIEQQSNAILETLQEIVNSRNMPLRPAKLRKLFGQFNNIEQQDVSEFLNQLVDGCIPLKDLFKLNVNDTYTC